MWGLRAPARVWREEGTSRVDCEDPADALQARGFVDAAVSMPAMDLARRLWSGRLAELWAERELAGQRAPELDVFVRTLAFRRAAERAYRAAPDRGPLDEYAAGVNAWIDSGAWSGHPFWAEQDTRPRLWAPADAHLIATAPAQVDGAAGLLLVHGDARATWPEAWDRRLRGLWAALSARDLRAPGGVGAGAETWTAGPAPARGTPMIRRIEILPQADHNAVQQPDGRIRRLRARRHDLAVRGAPVVRPWIREADDGPLVSDLLAGATGARPPAGGAFVWAWPPAPGTATERPREPLDRPLVPRPPPSLAPLRLVPLEGGA